MHKYRDSLNAHNISKFDIHEILLLNLVANLAKHIRRIIVRGSNSVKCYINIAC